MNRRKLVISATLLACAVAIMFPPWGWQGDSFQSFAFILSKHVPDAEYPRLGLSIAWRYLMAEIAIILLVGASLYILTPKRS